jgi:hypothetical protein
VASPAAAVGTKRADVTELYLVGGTDGREPELIESETALPDAEWLLRLEPVPDFESSRSVEPALIGLVAGLAQAAPVLQQLLSQTPALQVAFSPATMAALQAGTLKFMGGSMPAAVSQAGKIGEHARLVPGAGAAIGTGGALTLTTALPLVLVAAGVAASIAHERWLQQAFTGLSDQLDRIETRLRDDDLGTLDAADRLADLIVRLATDQLPDQLRLELAEARQNVEGIYFSRRRFVERFESFLEQSQDDAERRARLETAWVGDIAKRMASDDLVAELVVFLRAMITRARLAAFTAGVLANAGDVSVALTLLDEIEDHVRQDYWPLQRRLAALARTQPDDALLSRFMKAKERSRAVENAKRVSGALEEAIGARLPERDREVSVAVPTSSLALVS